MNIAVVGSRGFTDYELLRKTLLGITIKYDPDDLCIISGGARGADSLAEQFAKDKGIKTKIFYPDWEKYGHSAGYIRNHQIINNCDICVAFWDGKSKGTNHSISLANKHGKQVKVINY